MMRPTMLASLACAVTVGSVAAQGVPENSQSARVEMGYRRPSSFRVDPFRHVMLPHWGLIVSAGATGENSVLNFADVGALKFIDDNDKLLPGDVLDVLGLIPRGKGVRATAQGEGGASLNTQWGSHLTIGFSAQGRGYGAALVSDSLVSLLREGNLDRQNYDLGRSGATALATAEFGAHAVLRFGPIGGAEGAHLALGMGGRMIRPGAYVRVRSEPGTSGSIRVTGDSIITDVAIEALYTPDDGIEDRFSGGLGSGMVGDFLMRLDWPTQGFAFEAMVANLGTVTVESVQRDTASFIVATNDPRDDLPATFDSLSLEVRDSINVDVNLPKIVRLSAGAWANAILQLDVSTTIRVGGDLDTPLAMDIGSTWRFLRHLPLRAGVIVGGHQGLGFSGGFALESRNFLLRVAGQSLGGFMKNAKGVGARFDFGLLF